VIRAIGREPASMLAFQEELARTAGVDPRLDAATDALAKMLSGLGTDRDQDARDARTIAGLIARTLQASLLVRAAGDAGALLLPRHSWPAASAAPGRRRSVHADTCPPRPPQQL
jgi:putative acyl-CoA dehydrogenase